MTRRNNRGRKALPPPSPLGDLEAALHRTQPRQGDDDRQDRPLRAEVRFDSERGYRLKFGTWADVAAWLAGEDFARTAPAVSKVTIVRPGAPGGGIPSDVR